MRIQPIARSENADLVQRTTGNAGRVPSMMGKCRSSLSDNEKVKSSQVKIALRPNDALAKRKNTIHIIIYVRWMLSIQVRRGRPTRRLPGKGRQPQPVWHKMLPRTGSEKSLYMCNIIPSETHEEPSKQALRFLEDLDDNSWDRCLECRQCIRDIPEHWVTQSGSVELEKLELRCAGQS